MSDLVTVGAFTSPLDAHLAKGRLEAEGITAFIAHENHVWAMWMYSHALGGVKLQVSRERAEEARKILDAHAHGAYEAALAEEFPDMPTLGCPRCGSTAMQRRISWKNALFAVLTLGILGVLFPVTKKLRRCQQCGATWRP